MSFNYLTNYFQKTQSYEIEVINPDTGNKQVDFFVEDETFVSKYLFLFVFGCFLIACIYNIYLQIQLNKKIIMEKVYFKAISEKERLKKKYEKLKAVFDRIDEISNKDDRSAKKLGLITSQICNHLKRY
jgi:hypothetical protein